MYNNINQNSCCNKCVYDCSKLSCCKTCPTCIVCPTGPTEPTGATGATGITGATGTVGPTTSCLCVDQMRNIIQQIITLYPNDNIVVSM